MVQQFRFSVLLILVFTFFISCEDDSNSQPIEGLPSTLDVLLKSEEHIIFSNLIETYNLKELLNSGTYTVFAPVDAVFDQINLTELNDSEITNLLRYHIIQGNAQSGDLSNTYLNTESNLTINENETNLNLLITLGESIILNGNAKIIEADIQASNGTVHSIDEVLKIPKLSDLIENDPNLTSLLAAFTWPGQPNYLVNLGTEIQTQPAPFTLFAPNNNAFTEALTLLEIESLDDLEINALTEILNLHLVTNANLREIDFTEDGIETEGGLLNYDLENNQIIDFNEREIAFSIRNIQASNGVLHVLENVILPESDLANPGNNENEVSFTLNNDANSAYFISEINGNENVSVLSENNSTWTLLIGSRYNINVVNAGSHPLELRNQANETLLAQSEIIQGSFESDEAINFTVEGTIFSFTLTQELASQLSSYFCSNHPSMNGDIIVN
ncbi:fasciclin domain-containing protein [Psychroflexus salis]|nr:fasciclin domain-containing protein [Psychroflexus salis]